MDNIRDTLDNSTVQSYPLFGFRLLFYLIHPEEIPDYKDVNDVPVYANQMVVPFVSLFVIELLVKVLMTGKTFRVNDTISSVGAGMISQTGKFLFRGFDIVVYIYLYNHHRLYDIPLRAWWAWALTFLAADLGYYWFHRISHEVSIFWASHQTHHSSKEYNLSTALRQSVFSAVYSWVVYLPMAVVGFSPVAYVVHVQLNTLYQFWIHTAVIKRLGILELFLNTPSHHRVHHGRNRYCIDKNYAGVLIIWDKMFGTFEGERDEDPVVYGILSPLDSFNGIWVQTCYYIHNIGRFCTIPGLPNKLRSLFYGPGWEPGTPRLGDPKALPDIKGPVEAYNPQIPRWKTIYCIVHFIATLYSFDHCSRHYNEWEIHQVWMAAAAIIFSIGNIGSVLDGSLWVRVAEIVRSVVLVKFFAANWLVLSSTETLVLQLICAASCAVWVVGGNSVNSVTVSNDRKSS